MNRQWGLTLGDVAEFIRGVTYKPGDVSTADDREAIPCMRTKNIQEQLETDDLVYIPQKPIAAQKRLRRGDILVSSANSWNLVGKCSWVPELPYEATFGGFTSVLRANPDRVDPRYLYRWFSSTMVQTVVRSFGQQTTNISNLNQNLCLGMRLSLPPLDEQQRIAAILDKADALRQKRKRAIALLDSLTQSIFSDLFGDPAHNRLGLPVGKIGDLLESATYGSSGKAGAEGEYPMLRMGNLTNAGQMDYSDLKYIDLVDSETDRYTVKRGDILFNRTNSAELVGKTAVFDRDEPYAFAGYLVRARTRSGYSPEYVSGYLNSSHGKKTLRGMAKSIVGMANINAKEMQTIPILIPDQTSQQQYTQLVGGIWERQGRYRASLAEIEHLFASLQHRAFSGQL